MFQQFTLSKCLNVANALWNIPFYDQVRQQITIKCGNLKKMHPWHARPIKRCIDVTGQMKNIARQHYVRQRILSRVICLLGVNASKITEVHCIQKSLF